MDGTQVETACSHRLVPPAYLVPAYLHCPRWAVPMFTPVLVSMLRTEDVAPRTIDLLDSRWSLQLGGKACLERARDGGMSMTTLAW